MQTEHPRELPDVPGAGVHAAGRSNERRGTVRSGIRLLQGPRDADSGLLELGARDGQALHVFQLRQGLHSHFHAEPAPTDGLRQDQKHERQVEVSPVHQVLRHRRKPRPAREIRVRRQAEVLLHLLQSQVHPTVQPDQTPPELPQRELREREQRGHPRVSGDERASRGWKELGRLQNMKTSSRREQTETLKTSPALALPSSASAAPTRRRDAGHGNSVPPRGSFVRAGAR